MEFVYEVIDIQFKDGEYISLSDEARIVQVLKAYESVMERNTWNLTVLVERESELDDNEDV